MTLEEIKKELIGQIVQEVDNGIQGADSSLRIIFHNGTTLEFGYSGCEGTTYYNGDRIPELD